MSHRAVLVFGLQSAACPAYKTPESAANVSSPQSHLTAEHRASVNGNSNPTSGNPSYDLKLFLHVFISALNNNNVLTYLLFFTLINLTYFCCTQVKRQQKSFWWGWIADIWVSANCLLIVDKEPDCTQCFQKWFRTTCRQTSTRRKRKSARARRICEHNAKNIPNRLFKIFLKDKAHSCFLSHKDKAFSHNNST